MSVAVRYCSRTGNTRKLAQAIASALGVRPETVEVPLSEKTEIVFLGSAVYAAGVDESVKRFLRTNKDKIGTLYCFSTAALIPSTYPQIKKLAAENGITIASQEFHCRGAFSLLHKGRPNSADLEAAAAFAKSAANGG